MVDLLHLRYFAAVAEELSFRRAAERLHVAQPGLSQRIKGLERTLKVTLFVRGPRGVELTPAGAALLPAVERLLGQADEVVRLARRLSSPDPPELRLSYTRSARDGVPTRLVERFRAKRPDVEVSAVSGFTSMNLERLEQDRIDAGFVRPPIEAGAWLDHMIVAQEPIMVAMRRGHRLAKRRRVRRDDLRGEPLVFFPRDAAPGLWETILEQVYRDRRPVIMRAEPDEEHMLAAVADGGITLLTQSPAGMLRVHDVVAKRFYSPEPSAPIGIAWRRDDTNPALRDFLDFVRTAAMTARP